MTEYLTQAVVLGYRPQKENDRLVDLYTKDFGRLEVRVIGGRRILSKLSPHLDLFNLATVRLVEKKSVTLTDVLSDDDFGKERRSPDFYPKFLKILSLVRALTPKAMPDTHLWHYLVKGLKTGNGDVRTLLKVLGYDPQHAACDSCNRSPVSVFRIKDQSFFCRSCSLKDSPDGIIYF